MSSFHDHGDTSRLDGLLDGDGDLFSQTFLDLKTATESFGDAGEFGKAKDEFVGNIGNGDLWEVYY